MYRFANIGIQVHGIYKIHIGIHLAKILHGCYHADESVAKVLAAMSGYEHQFLAVFKACYVISGFF